MTEKKTAKAAHNQLTNSTSTTGSNLTDKKKTDNQKKSHSRLRTYTKIRRKPRRCKAGTPPKSIHHKNLLSYKSSASTFVGNY